MSSDRTKQICLWMTIYIYILSSTHRLFRSITKQICLWMTIYIYIYILSSTDRLFRSITKQICLWMTIYIYIYIVIHRQTVSFYYETDLSVDDYVYIYIYIYIYIYCYSQTDFLVQSEIFSVARHAGPSKPGSKLYIYIYIYIYILIKFKG